MYLQNLLNLLMIGLMWGGRDMKVISLIMGSYVLLLTLDWQRDK